MTPAYIVETASRCLSEIRQRSPRVHCLTNTVVQKFMADGLSALGAHPSMTSSIDEVASFVARTDIMVVNLGTLDPARRESSRVAVAEARKLGRRWVLDPVHCNLSDLRLVFARELIEAGPAVVRGNHAEMAAIGTLPDNVVRVETGARDTIAFAGTTITVSNGHPLMAQVTGTGCLAGGVLAAFVAVEPDALKAAAAAMAAIGVAAELAAPFSRGPGTFGPALLDALAALDADALQTHARIDISHAQG
ncbi:hydroxyethylthiazole kinase [Corticibacterium sp. UT-5YL-CI-8]|nr:hydroxyethylthiazole kinase [Tianweitania sp. UT-5YL-CI-8]